MIRYILPLTLLSAIAFAADGAWVRLSVEEGKRGDATYMYYGQVRGNLDDLQKNIKGDDFILVSNLRCFVDKKWIKWSEWDPMLQDVVLVRPSKIVAIMPLSGDPVDTAKNDNGEKKQDGKALY